METTNSSSSLNRYSNKINIKEMDLLASIIAQTIGDLNVVITDTNQKTIQLKSSSNLQTIKRENSDKSIKLCENETKRKQATDGEESNHKRDPLNARTWSPLSYDLIKILRKHSRRGDPEDEKTSIWGIKFKPTNSGHNGQQLVATCGGNIVNVIDLKTGSVCGRYTDTNDCETLNCIDWRDFIINTNTKQRRELSLICVGGTKKDNKLVNIIFINSDNVKDYLKVGSHSQSVNCLLFHPKHRNLLFSGSYDRKIMVWILDWNNVTMDSSISSITVKKLKEIDCHNRALSLVFVPKTRALVVAGEDGLVFMKDPTLHESDAGCVHSVQMPTKTRLVDGSALIDEKLPLIAFRYRESIIVADLDKMMASVKEPNISGSVELCRVTQLRYCHLKCNYFYMSAESRLLCCGDASGRIRLYYLKDSVLRPQQQQENNAVEPIRVLAMPQLNKVSSDKQSSSIQSLPSMDKLFVNTTAISPNHEYIVSGTNTNLICIWRRSKPSMSSHSSATALMHKKLKTVNAL